MRAGGLGAQTPGFFLHTTAAPRPPYPNITQRGCVSSSATPRPLLGFGGLQSSSTTAPANARQVSCLGGTGSPGTWVVSSSRRAAEVKAGGRSPSPLSSRGPGGARGRPRRRAGGRRAGGRAGPGPSTGPAPPAGSGASPGRGSWSRRTTRPWSGPGAAAARGRAGTRRTAGTRPRRRQPPRPGRRTTGCSGLERGSAGGQAGNTAAWGGGEGCRGWSDQAPGCNAWSLGHWQHGTEMQLALGWALPHAANSGVWQGLGVQSWALGCSQLWGGGFQWLSRAEMWLPLGWGLGPWGHGAAMQLALGCDVLAAE